VRPVLASAGGLTALPVRHAVRRGDSLWRIARQRLGDAREWPRIAAANPGLVTTRLPVGRELVIP
jgi:nucleoid-associated protein YgaU